MLIDHSLMSANPVLPSIFLSLEYIATNQIAEDGSLVGVHSGPTSWTGQTARQIRAQSRKKASFSRALCTKAVGNLRDIGR